MAQTKPDYEKNAYNIPSDISQDFTGLIPAGKGKEEDLEMYSEIFPFYEKIPTTKR